MDFENNYIVNNLNPDFDLSRYYHRDLLASDWQTIMLNSKIDNEGFIILKNLIIITIKKLLVNN